MQRQKKKKIIVTGRSWNWIKEDKTKRNGFKLNLSMSYPSRKECYVLHLACMLCSVK